MAVVRLAGYAIGGVTLAVAAIVLLPIVTLWLLTAFVLDVADGGLLA